MRAASYQRYGASDVVNVIDTAEPVPTDDQVLVDVHASTVTTADWRLRASAFPNGMWLVGRLMMGLFAPRNPVLGHEFSGTVVATGKNVTRFAVGDVSRHQWSWRDALRRQARSW